jgi:cardiolipin synthase A/B
MTGGRRLAAAGAAGLAAAYGWTAARYAREQADGFSARGVPPAGSPEFGRVLESLTMTPVREGNRVTILRNGVETFPSMLEAIEAAEHTVDFSSYIYWPGEITERFTEAFVERARSGVEVSVVLDGYGSARLDRDTVRRMEDAGVDVRFFRPPRWHSIGDANNRMHRRLLVVDGRVGFAGGVGIADVWTGDAEDPEHWRETHARFEGPVVRDVLGGFLESWTDASRELRAGRRFPELEPFEGGCPVQVTRSSPLGGDTAVAQLFLLSLAAAHERVWMTTAYFTAGRRFLRALCDASNRGVDVRILVNGRAVDKEVVRKTGQRSYGPLLEAGVRIFEYDRTMLHAKTMVVDESWSTLGSSNFDHRSFALDAELNVAVYDRTVTEVLADHFREDVKEARELDLDGWRSRPLRKRALEAAGELARQSF